MIDGIIISIIFWFSVCLQTNFLNATGSVLASIPFVLIVGTLVIQRYGSATGIIWFALSAPAIHLFGFSTASFFSYLLSGVIAVLLAKRVFTSHSVYGLTGLSISTYLIFLIINASNIYSGSLIGIVVLLASRLLSAIIATYCIFVIDVYARRFFSTLFTINGTKNRFI